MKTRLLALALPLALGLACGSGTAAGEDLLQIYREALVNDPQLAAARSTWLAAQEVLPQARAGLLPTLSLLGAAAQYDYNNALRTDPQVNVHHQYSQGSYTLQASQPLYRPQNWISFDQAKQQIDQSQYSLASAQQDTVVRVVQSYFDVLLAKFSIELVLNQKAQVAENLAESKRRFEVGTATIIDTNEAQAKYDAILAQEIQARNDYDNKIATLRAIIGRTPKELKGVETEIKPEMPAPTALEPWVDKALGRITRSASSRRTSTSRSSRSSASGPATTRRSMWSRTSIRRSRVARRPLHFPPTSPTTRGWVRSACSSTCRCTRVVQSTPGSVRRLPARKRRGRTSRPRAGRRNCRRRCRTRTSSAVSPK